MLALLATSCKDKDVFDETQNQNPAKVTEANTFDFCTSQLVKLNVDYSAYKTHGPVYFSVYSQNPFEESEEILSLKKDVLPIYENYTNAQGKFNDNITLPAYAKELYIVTGNFFVQDNVITAKVQNGSVNAVAENYGETPAATRAGAVTDLTLTGTPTNSLETLYQLSYEVDVNTGAKKDNDPIYKEWQTPLGQWDSESGRPLYLLDKNTANPSLVFNEEEMEGLYQTISNALVANQNCNEIYIKQADLTLERESEVAITFLGGITCWNNTMGYYYYTEDTKPTSLMDINIIMLFPNTQEGKWFNKSNPHPNFYGNIALERGDCVKLMYYPNIANGDLSGATDKFPKGTKLGFILKPNGWGMQLPNGNKVYYNSYKGAGILNNSSVRMARQYNVWAASTDGLSYCNPEMIPSDAGAMNIVNANASSRTAKFAYRNDKGEEFAIISFEDACNDLDFDDVVFALKPYSAFSNLPVVEEKKTENYSVYAYEDLWPAAGDYDLNDVVVELKHEKTYSKLSTETEYKVKKQMFALTTYQNYVELTSGLGLTLETPSTPTSVVMKKVNPQSVDTLTVNFTQDGNVYLLTDDVKSELGATYILEINYDNGIANEENNMATVKPFIFRAEENDSRWEVHIPFEAPTAKMNFSYFHTLDDLSDVSNQKYFIRANEYPFAFCLTGVTIESFIPTILKRENESVKISDLYPGFLLWSTSKGTQNQDWYIR